MRIRIISFLTSILLVAACAPTPSTAAPLPSTDEAAPPTQAESNPSALLWKEVRNERYGFGIAVPCWWEVTPMPAEGVIASMTIRSYDEAFFAANSERGEWIGGVPPQGAVSMDITAATGMDPSLTVTDSYAQLIDGTSYSIIHSQERALGKNRFTVITLKSFINENAPPSIVYISSLSPDTILIFSVIPVDALYSDDVQAILSSYAAANSDPVTMPKIPPGPALIEKSCPI
ncbi:hypothetical protein FBQ99_05610 [Chloroflexi bacterium CFX2]|nr:hypothetical protein [Chloroflexi bacterium CFX2]